MVSSLNEYEHHAGQSQEMFRVSADLIFPRVGSRKDFFTLLACLSLSTFFTFPCRRLEPRRSPIIAEEIIKKPGSQERY